MRTTILTLALLAAATTAQAYEQLDQYAPAGFYGAIHRSPDFAVRACMNPSDLPSIMRVEFRTINGRLYAMSSEDRVVKKTWAKLNSCNRLAYGTYTCTSNIAGKARDARQVISYLNGQVKVSFELTGPSGQTCLLQYE